MLVIDLILLVADQNRVRAVLPQMQVVPTLPQTVVHYQRLESPRRRTETIRVLSSSQLRLSSRPTTTKMPTPIPGHHAPTTPMHVIPHRSQKVAGVLVYNQAWQVLFLSALHVRKATTARMRSPCL